MARMHVTVAEPPKMGKAARREWTEILWKDPCAYCGSRVGGFQDHIRAKSRGGKDDWTNLTGACETCNMSKGTISLLAFLGRRDARVRLEQQVRRWRGVGSEDAA